MACTVHTDRCTVRAWAGPPLLAIVSGEAARDKLGCAPTCNMQHATFEAARCALRARLCAWPLAHLTYARGMTCAHAAQPQICGRECARCRATAAQPQRCGQASLIKGLARQRLAWRIVGSVDSRAETRRQSAEGYRRNQTRAQTPKTAALPRRLAPPCCGGARTRRLLRGRTARQVLLPIKRAVDIAGSVLLDVASKQGILEQLAVRSVHVSTRVPHRGLFGPSSRRTFRTTHTASAARCAVYFRRRLYCVAWPRCCTS